MNGKELDIFIPSINIGVEYDGSYYHHTNAAKEKDLRKTLFFLEKGYALFG